MVDPLNPVSLIGTVGFPAAAFLLMYRLVDNTIDQNTQAIQESRAAIQELTNELRYQSWQRRGRNGDFPPERPFEHESHEQTRTHDDD